MKRTVKCLKLVELPMGDGPWQIAEHRLLEEGELLIVLDNGCEIAVDAQAFYEGSWKDGDLVSKEELNELLAARLERWGQEKVLRYLSYRPRTEAEVKRYLGNLQLPARIIDQLVARLKELGLVDDARFIELWVESRLVTNPMGRRRLMAELLEKGIEKSLIVEKLDELAERFNEEEVAIQLAVKQMRHYHKLDEQQRIRKLMGFLQRRGFSSDVIRTAVQTALGAEEGMPASGDCLDSL